MENSSPHTSCRAVLAFGLADFSGDDCSYALLLTYFKCLGKVYIIHFLLVGNNGILYNTCI